MAEAAAPNELTDLDLLKRFLYTGVVDNYFIGPNIRNPGKKKSWPSSFKDDFIRSVAENPNFPTIMDTANENVDLINRETLFTVIARILNCDSVHLEEKTAAKTMLFRYMKTDKDFFQFIKVYSNMLRKNKTNKKKFPTVLKKIARKWYEERTPKELATMVAKRLSYHKWTHKNVFKLCHIKTKNHEKELIIRYALFGLKQEHDEDNEINTILKQHHQLRKSEDQLLTVSLITPLEGNGRQISSRLNRDRMVLEQIFSFMSPRKILKNLKKLEQLRFLDDNAFQYKLRSILTTTEGVREGRLHPLEVDIYFKRFETGGRPLDKNYVKHLEQQPGGAARIAKANEPYKPRENEKLLRNISSCLTESYRNIKKGCRQVLITLDVTRKMEKHCHLSRIETFEAMSSIVTYFQRQATYVKVSVFNDDRLTDLPLKKGQDFVAKLRNYSASYISPVAPIQWAMKKKKIVDVFINITACEWKHLVPPRAETNQQPQTIKEMLKKYNAQMKTDARLVRMFLGGHYKGSDAHEVGKNILTISGYEPEVPKVLDAFCTKIFA